MLTANNDHRSSMASAWLMSCIGSNSNASSLNIIQSLLPGHCTQSSFWDRRNSAVDHVQRSSSSTTSWGLSKMRAECPGGINCVVCHIDRGAVSGGHRRNILDPWQERGNELIDVYFSSDHSPGMLLNVLSKIGVQFLIRCASSCWHWSGSTVEAESNL